MLFIGVLSFIFFAIFASLYLESFWSNAITLVNVTLAALLAMSFYEPVAAMLDARLASFTYFWDYLSLWLVFVIAFAILRGCTDFVSRNRVKFKLPIELAGRMLCAAGVGLVMVSFIMTSFHVAPLPPSPFSGGFANNPTGMSLDHTFLNFVQYTSRGSLSRGPIAGGPQSPYPDDAYTNTFDPNADFVLKYRQRRKNLDSIPDALRVNTQ